METYAKDLEGMAKEAFAVGDCKDCINCKDINKCIKGIRFGMGDLAETLAWMIREMHRLDTSVVDIVGMAPKKTSEPDYFQ